ncbi:MAG TPA: hypothetical protein DEA22_14635 [Blastocatellia bacterium]|nr:hypothetical protein [Blastocatellia bacterium]
MISLSAKISDAAGDLRFLHPNPLYLFDLYQADRAPLAAPSRVDMLAAQKTFQIILKSLVIPPPKCGMLVMANLFLWGQ